MLHLVRHCQTTGQEPTAPLTALGHAQAERLADALEPLGIVRIVSSPYLRASQSAQPLAKRLGLAVETDDRLVERVLSTVRTDDWRERLRASWDDHDLILPGGESTRQATARGMAAIADIVADARQPVVIVTHGNLLSLLLHALDGRPGFETWEALTNPDIFQVCREPSEGGSSTTGWSVTRTWRALE